MSLNVAFRQVPEIRLLAHAPRYYFYSVQHRLQQSKACHQCFKAPHHMPLFVFEFLPWKKKTQWLQYIAHTLSESLTSAFSIAHTAASLKMSLPISHIKGVIGWLRSQRRTLFSASASYREDIAS